MSIPCWKNCPSVLRGFGGVLAWRSSKSTGAWVAPNAGHHKHSAVCRQEGGGTVHCWRAFSSISSSLLLGDILTFDSMFPGQKNHCPFLKTDHLNAYACGLTNHFPTTTAVEAVCCCVEDFLSSLLQWVLLFNHRTTSVKGTWWAVSSPLLSQATRS